MFDIKCQKPGSSTDIIMGVGTKNGSAHSVNQDSSLAPNRSFVTEMINQRKNELTYLLI